MYTKFDTVQKTLCKKKNIVIIIDFFHKWPKQPTINFKLLTTQINAAYQ